MESDNFYYNKDIKELARRLRNNSTKAEVVLWKEILRGGKMHGYTFLRQRPVKTCIADFMNKDLRLIIEVDGMRNVEKTIENWVVIHPPAPPSKGDKIVGVKGGTGNEDN